ncbi:MAG: glutathione S-transferase family protein [Pseudomonadota bacterium]
MSSTLHIGPKNYSSWSLRPWLALRWGGIAFDEHLIWLGQPGYGQGEIADVKAVSPAGTVPALHVDGLVIWDSLAIAEWAAEQTPSLWPADGALRAQARSATAEMHSGFAGIRRDMPMNIQRRCTVAEWPDDTQRNLRRLFELWTGCREAHHALGPWLFGTRSIADAFYTPVATRLRTYGVEMNALCQAYVDTLLGDEHFIAWEQDSETGVWDKPGFPVIDGLYW